MLRRQAFFFIGYFMTFCIKNNDQINKTALPAAALRLRRATVHIKQRSKRVNFTKIPPFRLRRHGANIVAEFTIVIVVGANPARTKVGVASTR